MSINWRPETEEKEALLMEHLDPEEREILAAQNADDYEFPPSDMEQVKRLKAAARVTMAKSERITIRLTPADLQAIKHCAAREGVPYQTLIASLIHKYVTGQLVPRPSRESGP